MSFNTVPAVIGSLGLRGGIAQGVVGVLGVVAPTSWMAGLLVDS